MRFFVVISLIWQRAPARHENVSKIEPVPAAIEVGIRCQDIECGGRSD